MAGADPGSVISVKVLIKQQMVLPVRTLLEHSRSAEHRPLPFGITKKNADQTPRELSGYLPEGGLLSRPERIFHLVVIAQEKVEFL